jgi:hypothetical protein
VTLEQIQRGIELWTRERDRLNRLANDAALWCDMEAATIFRSKAARAEQNINAFCEVPLRDQPKRDEHDLRTP